MHVVEQGGRVDYGEDRGEGGTLRHSNRLIPFISKEVVKAQAYPPIGKESPRPCSQRGVKAHCGDDSREAIVVDVIEEANALEFRHIFSTNNAIEVGCKHS